MYFAALALIVVAVIPSKHFTVLLTIYEKLKLKFILYIPLFCGKTFKQKLFYYEEKIFVGEIVRLNPDDRYKFYPQILMILQEQTLKKGIHFKKNFQSFKKNFLRDLEHEEEIFQILKNGVFQFVMISLATWVFIFFSSRLIDFSQSSFIYILVFCLQLLGFALFIFLSFKMRTLKFKRIDDDVFKVILFTSLLECGTPLNIALNESDIYQLKSLNELLEYIKKFIERGRKTGIFQVEDIEEIRHSFWYQYKEKIIQFKKSLAFLKFLILTFIFLPAYFLYLTSIFQFFMEH